MKISIKRSELCDVDRLLIIQKEAFAEDYQLYQDHETTPVNETSEILIENMKNAIHYTIWCNDELIGGIDIRRKENAMLLDKIFIANHYQNKGLGSTIMQIMEAEFPNIENWRLYTPHLNTRNHYFYQKLGFIKTGEIHLTEKLSLFKFEKIISRKEEHQ